MVVLRNGSFRIPSRVCATATTLFFGDDARTRAGCGIYEIVENGHRNGSCRDDGIDWPFPTGIRTQRCRSCCADDLVFDV